jgi:hypothetical protein
MQICILTMQTHPSGKRYKFDVKAVSCILQVTGFLIGPQIPGGDGYLEFYTQS